LLAQLGYPASAEAVARRLERLDASDADVLLLAEADDAVVGLGGLHTSLSLEYDQPAAKLSALVVDEAWRGRGVGKGLVTALEEEARARGCGLLFLTTNERRADAHAFYARLGFEHTGRRYAKRI
jgi:GNAT superfamily N-acetyltransferase